MILKLAIFGQNTLNQAFSYFQCNSDIESFYYMAKPVFTLRLVNLQIITHYTDQNKMQLFILLSKSLSAKKVENYLKLSVNPNNLAAA